MVDEGGNPKTDFCANDVYNLKLPAELVTLSGCQTGLGKAAKGEGLIGLTRGFMYSGAARVVVSLWNVNDQATSELMARFYRKILKRESTPGGRPPNGAGRDVETAAMASAVLLGHIRLAGRMEIANYFASGFRSSCRSVAYDSEPSAIHSLPVPIRPAW